MIKIIRERWFVFFLIVYFGLIACLSRGVSVDLWDGLLSILNALSLVGAESVPPIFTISRPPIGYLILSPVLGGAFRWGGLSMVIPVCHFIMPLFLIVLFWVCHQFFLRLYSPFVAGFTVLAMSFNPLLIRYAPFALFDIGAALFMIPFLYAGYRYLQAPSAKAYAALVFTYCLAVLFRYHLCILFLAPLACHFFTFRGGGLLLRLHRWLTTPLWLLPPLGYVLTILFMGCILWSVSPGSFIECLREVHQDLLNNVFLSNVAGKESVSWTKYFISLWRQLGPGLFFAMIFGVSVWLRRRSGMDKYFASSFLVLVAAMSFGINHKEQRHLIALLPLAYLAVGEGLRALLSRLPDSRLSQVSVLACASLLFPWTRCLASFRFLRSEPAIHSDAPRQLGRILESETPAEGCVGWIDGDIVFHNQMHSELIDGNEQMFLLGSPVMPLFTKRKVVERRGASWGECRPSMVVQSRTSSGAGMNDSTKEAVLAKVYEISAGDGRQALRWEVFLNGVRPAAEIRRSGRRPPGGAP